MTYLPLLLWFLVKFVMTYNYVVMIIGYGFRNPFSIRLLVFVNRTLEEG